ncbi:MAG: DinB family protein [Proteobacteria bacterium]|nr:DinB family protein [Pseudomonadota bacterium]
MRQEQLVNPPFAATMARYNQWQNRSLVAAASSLTDQARQAPRGAFFGSIAATFNHLYWGDAMWMHRFSGSEKPAGSIKDSTGLFAEWAVFKQARADLDAAILTFADSVSEEWLAGELTWLSSAAQRQFSRPRALLVMHFFNHQTHHRGQIHAMLTAAGARPDDTDLMLAPWLE